MASSWPRLGGIVATFWPFLGHIVATDWLILAMEWPLAAINAEAIHLFSNDFSKTLATFRSFDSPPDRRADL